MSKRRGSAPTPNEGARGRFRALVAVLTRDEKIIFFGSLLTFVGALVASVVLRHPRMLTTSLMPAGLIGTIIFQARARLR